MPTKKSRLDVLNYSREGVGQGTVRAHYDEYLVEKGLPKRCEIPICMFHTGPLVWNGLPITLILDHKDGCNTNNSVDNLRYLCPNCNQQQPTTGGGNNGRIKDRGEDGYSVQERGETKRTVSKFLTTKWNIEQSVGVENVAASELEQTKDDIPELPEGDEPKQSDSGSEVPQ